MASGVRIIGGKRPGRTRGGGRNGKRKARRNNNAPAFGKNPQKRGHILYAGQNVKRLTFCPTSFIMGEEQGKTQLLWRWISCTGNTFASGAPALSPATIRSTAQRQMSSTGWWMVVRGGVVRQARRVSS